jgi:hypothetical protein
MQEARINDVGTRFVIQLKRTDGSILDVSEATEKYIVFRKPNSAAGILKAASFTTDGKDGKIQYITGSGDIDKLGYWQIQALVKFGSATWRSSTGKFVVYESIE